jgi:hypothetical protein
MSDNHLKATRGIAPGMTVQFADGKWPGEIGAGVVMSDAAFDWVEPLVQRACAGWTSDHRYGVFELSPQDRQALAPLLRKQREPNPNARCLRPSANG